LFPKDRQPPYFDRPFKGAEVKKLPIHSKEAFTTLG
jgi:hypothetical protein